MEDAQQLQVQKVLLYDPERCTGCRFCEMACSYKHFGVISFRKSNLRIVFDGERLEFEAVNCQHCVEPVCVAACPSEALSKDEETGWVRINPLKCIGCKTCVYICPLSAPWFDEDLNVAVKCDFCDGDPMCAKYCSPGAIRVVSRVEAVEFAKKLYVGG